MNRSLKMGVLCLFVCGLKVTTDIETHYIYTSNLNEYGQMLFYKQRVSYLLGSADANVTLIKIEDDNAKLGCYSLTIKPATFAQTCFQLEE